MRFYQEIGASLLVAILVMSGLRAHAASGAFSVIVTPIVQDGQNLYRYTYTLTNNGVASTSVDTLDIRVPSNADLLNVESAPGWNSFYSATNPMWNQEASFGATTVPSELVGGKIGVFSMTSRLAPGLGSYEIHFVDPNSDGGYLVTGKVLVPSEQPPLSEPNFLATTSASKPVSPVGDTFVRDSKWSMLGLFVFAMVVLICGCCP